LSFDVLSFDVLSIRRLLLRHFVGEPLRVEAEGRTSTGENYISWGIRWQPTSRGISWQHFSATDSCNACYLVTRISCELSSTLYICE
jgi:hypothetical protein